jgi:Flp pilus assembly protein TadG
MRVAPIMNDVAVRLLIGVRERLAGLAKARHGATAVETAIVLPVFLLLLFGVIEAGLLFWTQSTLQSAVEAAARCAVVDKTNCGSTSAVQSYAASQAIGMTVPSASFDASPQSCGYQVSIGYNFSFIVSGLFPGTMTLNAKSCHPT